MSRPAMKPLYALMGVGVSLMFLGHGILALKGDPKFIELLTGTADKLLGSTVSTDTATSIVNVIGVVDVALAVGFALLAAAALRDHSIAFSRLALGAFGWAAIWGFVTALARFTATMNGAQIWEVVERGANFLLPAALVYMIYAVRSERTERAAEDGTAHQAGVRERLRHAIPVR